MLIFVRACCGCCDFHFIFSGLDFAGSRLRLGSIPEVGSVLARRRAISFFPDGDWQHQPSICRACRIRQFEKIR